MLRWRNEKKICRNWWRPWQDQVRQTQKDSSRRQFVASTVQCWSFFNISWAKYKLVTRNFWINKKFVESSPAGGSQGHNPPLSKREQKNTSGIYQSPQSAERMNIGKVAKIDFSDESSSELHPIAANTAEGLLESAWTQDSHRQQSSLVVEKKKIVVWGFVRVGVCVWEICRVNNLEYQEILSAHSKPQARAILQDNAPSHTSASI